METDKAQEVHSIANMRSLNQDDEISINYETPWPVYGMSWSIRADKPGRLAVTSYVEESQNYVSLLELKLTGTKTFELMHTTEYPFPATKVMWIPDPAGRHQDLVATSGDNLRIWSISDNGVQMASLLSNLNTESGDDMCPPMTSFDWCEVDVGMIVTASVDSTCTVWDIGTGQAKTQLIAHEHQVTDTAFAPESDVFASVGSDGSLRIFDPRAMEHSTIIYEGLHNMPLSRLAWNKLNANYIVAAEAYRAKFLLLDIRKAEAPVGQYQGHAGAITSLSWSPHSAHHLLTTGADGHSLIWDFSSAPDRPNDASALHRLPEAVNSGSWCPDKRGWISLASGSSLHMVTL